MLSLLGAGRVVGPCSFSAISAKEHWSWKAQAPGSALGARGTRQRWRKAEPASECSDFV